MDIEERIALVMRKPTEEVITPEDLRKLFEEKSRPKHYIGFEVSGIGHIGNLLIAEKMKHFKKAGIELNVFLADYHAWINNKLGGDLELIQKAGREYFTELYRAMGIDDANYVLASEIYKEDYWKLVLELSKRATIKRALRCSTIMGRKEGESIHTANIIYPLMQAADIFYMGIDIAHAGMDQRKVHVFAREINPSFVAVHNHILPSLQSSKKMDPYKDEELLDAKMSKSRPETAIYLHESKEEVERKVKKAFCPERQVEGNPVYEIASYVIGASKETLLIERKKEFGGDIEVEIDGELASLYSQGKIHPLDLKAAVARELNEMIEPVRQRFKGKESIIEMVKGKVSR
ncbi:MAG: tyrosine--tRNA ligase [Candidatus Anstonellales archaeon]